MSAGGEDDRPFVCTASGCGMRFTNEDHLTVHKEKHEMSLALDVGTSRSVSGFVADQTPTPTKFLKNCEEIGLFQDLNKNPFDDAFKRATDAINGANDVGMPGPSSLDTPPVLGSPFGTKLPPRILEKSPLTNDGAGGTMDGSGLRSGSARKRSGSPPRLVISGGHAEVGRVKFTTKPKRHKPSSLAIPTIHVTSPPTMVTSPPTIHVTSPPIDKTPTDNDLIVSVTVADAAEDVTILKENPDDSKVDASTLYVMVDGQLISLQSLLGSPCAPPVPTGHPLMAQMEPLVETEVGVDETQMDVLESHVDTSVGFVEAPIAGQMEVPIGGQMEVPIGGQMGPQIGTEILRPQSVGLVRALQDDGMGMNTQPAVTNADDTRQRLKAVLTGGGAVPPAPHAADLGVLTAAQQQTSPSKRLRRGVEEDPDRRREHFLERNRAAAARCRNKRKQQIEHLEKRCSELNNGNKRLQTEVNMLKDEVASLKLLLLAHKDCPVTRKQQEDGLFNVGDISSKPKPTPSPTKPVATNLVSSPANTYTFTVAGSQANMSVVQKYGVVSTKPPTQALRPASQPALVSRPPSQPVLTSTVQQPVEKAGKILLPPINPRPSTIDPNSLTGKLMKFTHQPGTFLLPAGGGTQMPLICRLATDTSKLTSQVTSSTLAPVTLKGSPTQPFVVRADGRTIATVLPSSVTGGTMVTASAAPQTLIVKNEPS